MKMKVNDVPQYYLYMEYLSEGLHPSAMRTFGLTSLNDFSFRMNISFGKDNMDSCQDIRIRRTFTLNSLDIYLKSYLGVGL